MISGIKNLIAFMQEIWHYVSKNIDFGYAMIQYMSFGHKSKLHSILKEKQMIFTIFTKKTNSSPKSLEAKLQSLDNALEKLELLYDCLYCNRSKNRFAYFKDCDLNTPLPPFPKLFHKITFTTPDINPPTQKHLLTGAANRVKNHLAYKLGSCLILNSKSFLGYIRMPYALSYLKAQHKMEQEKYQKNLTKNPADKLPKLESYADYKEALKEKQYFTYKLGEMLIEADKNWYKGGYLRFYFLVIPRLKREFQEKQR